MTHRRILAVLATAALLTACAPSDEPVKRSAADATTSTTTTTTTTSEDVSDHVAEVGETFEYDSGLTVSVVSVKKIRRDRWASGGKAGQPVVAVRVQIGNETGDKYDPALAMVSLRAGADGNEAEQVFQDGVDGTFSGSIAPGRKATATWAFSVDKADLGQLDITVAPSFDSEECLFRASL